MSKTDSNKFDPSTWIPIDLSGAEEALDEMQQIQMQIEALQNKIASDHLVRADLSPVPRSRKKLSDDIPLGSVLSALDLVAHHSWQLDGLLCCSIDDFRARFEAAAQFCDGEKAGRVLVRMLSDDPDALDQRGRYAAWRRRYIKYVESHRTWLFANPQMREIGKWRSARMTSGQSELVRITASALQIGLPGRLSRGEAHDWLEAQGANIRYRMVRP